MGGNIFVLVLLALATIQVTCRKDGNTTVRDGFKLRPIPDAVLITGGQETFGHIATWIVVVTLNIPAEQIELLNKLNKFQNVLYQHNRISNITKDMWNQRINEIISTISVTNVKRRHGRGLIDIVGTISNKLFGTATEDEVFEIRSRIERVAKQNKRVVNVVKDLVTIINQTHEQSKEVRQHIQSLESYVSKYAIEIRKLQEKTEKQRNRYDILETCIKTDRGLALIEATHNAWLRQQDRYHWQRTALELSYLTEDILPVQNLKIIIANAKRYNLYAPPLEWYYSHVRIEPLWQNDKILVFRANLPLTDRFTYLRYQLRSWAIPGNSSEFKTQLQVPGDIAFHTETGGIFEPTSCMGARPTICRTGPVYDRSRMQCARGIVTGEEKLRRQCLITITRAQTEASSVQELSPGEVLISTTGESLSLVCKGLAERRINLRGGLFILTLPTAYRINGRGWTMTGLARRSVQSTVSLPVIAIKPFRLATTITQRSVERHLNSPHWAILSKIEDLKISSLDVDPNEDSGIIWGLTTRSTIGTTVGILILVTVVILIIVMRFQKNRRATRQRREERREERREGKGSRDPQRASGCMFELIDHYDDAERRASTSGVIAVREAGDPTADVDVRANRGEQSRPLSQNSDTRSRLDVVFRKDAENWVRATTAQAAQ